MDVQKAWMVLQAYEMSLKLPNYPGIRAQLEAELAKINAGPEPQAIPAAEIPRRPIMKEDE